MTEVKRIRKIEAPIKAPTQKKASPKKRRVCGYARVSTDRDEQFTSYEAQIDYYTKFISAHDDWQFVKVYTDEGITGTSTKKRDGFNSMIADALNGKIDLIVTKSVSRFARNTVDSLTTIRELKENNVEVFFEKENIWTFDSKGELLITIMSSLAQEESRSISENVTWGWRKRISDGKVTLSFSRFLGYDKGPNGELIVNPEEAIVVQRIYKEFLDGKTLAEIITSLESDHVKTPTGLDNWKKDQICRMLRNEKYKGDALLQKTYTDSFLTKKAIKNDGSVPMYYVTGDHEAIIDPVMWDAAQLEYQNRIITDDNRISSDYLANRFRCGDCGHWYGVHHLKIRRIHGRGYKRVLWCQRLYPNRYIPSNNCQKIRLEEAEAVSILRMAITKYFDMKEKILMQYKMNTFDISDKTDEEIVKIHHHQYYSRQCVDWLNSLSEPPVKITDTLLDTILDEAIIHNRNDIDVKFKDGTVVHLTSF